MCRRRTVRQHYEISRYGTLIAWAEALGHDDIVRFLITNLNEEKAAEAAQRCEPESRKLGRCRSRARGFSSYPA